MKLCFIPSMKVLHLNLVCLFQVIRFDFSKTYEIITCLLWKFIGIVALLLIGLLAVLIHIDRARL